MMKKYRGSCHCEAVKFLVEAPSSVEVEDCNCSICSKSGYLHLIVPRSHFTLVSGKDCLVTYKFNTRVAEHLFCGTCGVKPFYIPRSNPDGIDINVNCLDERPANVGIVPFDGKNWEANAASLASKSIE